MTEPLLPPELERQIFLCALQNSRKDAPNLLSVAKKVETWLIPVLYEVVAIHSHPEYPTPFPKTREVYERYGKAVRHLLLEPDDMISYLPLFPNVTNLALWTIYDESLPGILERLALTRLSFTLSKFDPPSLALIARFSKITHLDLVGDLNDGWDCLPALKHFTSLTHLCVLWESNDEVVQNILDRHPLKVLILWDSDGENDSIVGLSPLNVNDRKLDDDRIVALRYNIVQDWENGARGDVDMWQREANNSHLWISKCCFSSNRSRLYWH